jgi:N-acetylneuraminate lyase
VVNGSDQWLQKIYSALITPMKEKENINYSIVKDLVEMQISEGVEGFYCCGSSGEGLLMTIEERKNFLETVLKAVNGRVPVISHVGTIRTAEVIELAKHAAAAGADAVSMIPPYYYKYSMDEIVDYYKAVINAIPHFKVLIYNIPQFTGIEFDSRNARALLELPNVIGVKHTSTNLFNLERMCNAYPEKLFLNGFDEMFLGALSMGAKGTIGTTVNLFAPLFIQLRNHFYHGQMKQALDLQKKINRNVEVMVDAGIFSAVKYGLSLRGIDCGQCRRPFKELDKDKKSMLDNLFKSNS